MPIIYRTDGAWGTGKGANLTAAEVDGNFDDLDTRVTSIEDNPPVAISPVDFEITNGNQLYVHMSDYSVLGPYTLPSGAWDYKGDWASGYTYAPNDIVTVPNYGTYLIIFEHVSAGIFDPFANDGAGHDYYRQMLSTPRVARWCGEWQADTDYVQYDLVKVSTPFEYSGVYQVAVSHTSDTAFDPNAATLPSGGTDYYTFMFEFPNSRLEIAPYFYVPHIGGTLYKFIASRSFILEVGLTTSFAKSAEASTGTAEWTLTKNNDPIGTVTFTTSTDGVFDLPHEILFEAGDQLGFVAPNPPDATLGNVAMNIVGTLL